MSLTLEKLQGISGKRHITVDTSEIAHYADENLEVSSGESFSGDFDYDEPNMIFEQVTSTASVPSPSTSQAKIQKIILNMPQQNIENSPETDHFQSCQTSMSNEFALEKLKSDLKHKEEIIKSYEKKEKQNEEQFRNMINTYEKKLKDCYSEITALKFKLQLKDLSFENLKINDKKVQELTGLTNFELLNKLFEVIKPNLSDYKEKGLSKFDCFVVTLSKLRLDLPISYLSYVFGVDTCVMSKMYRETLQMMNWKIGPLVDWPDDQTLLKNTPNCFKEVMGDKCIILIHFLEIIVKNLRTNSNIQYVKHKLRYLIAFTPGGEIIFVSKGFGSTATDEDIIKESGFFDKVTENHVFLSVKEMFEQKQKDDQQIQSIKQFAKHTEDKVLDLLKDNFRILFNRQTANSNGELYSEYTVRCCCALANLQMPEMIVAYAKEDNDTVVVHSKLK